MFYCQFLSQVSVLDVAFVISLPKKSIVMIEGATEVHSGILLSESTSRSCSLYNKASSVDVWKNSRKVFVIQNSSEVKPN